MELISVSPGSERSFRKESPLEDGDGQAAGHGYQSHLLNATKRPSPATAKPSPDPISSARTRHWAAEVTVQLGEECSSLRNPFTEHVGAGAWRVYLLS